MAASNPAVAVARAIRVDSRQVDAVASLVDSVVAVVAVRARKAE